MTPAWRRLSGLREDDMPYAVAEPAWWPWASWGGGLLLLAVAAHQVLFGSITLSLLVGFTGTCWLLGTTRFRKQTVLGSHRLLTPRPTHSARYHTIVAVASVDGCVRIEHDARFGSVSLGRAALTLCPVSPEDFVADLLDGIAADQGSEFASKLLLS